MARVKDAKNNVSFAPENSKPKGGKPLKTTLKVGMSKDSPFHTTGYTKVHPSTKQLLDYGQLPKPGTSSASMVTVVSEISKLPIEQQIQFYASQKQPKMFTNIMNEGMNKEMQAKISNFFNVNLR